MCCTSQVNCRGLGSYLTISQLSPKAKKTNRKTTNVSKVAVYKEWGNVHLCWTAQIWNCRTLPSNRSPSARKESLYRLIAVSWTADRGLDDVEQQLSLQRNWQSHPSETDGKRARYPTDALLVKEYHDMRLRNTNVSELSKDSLNADEPERPLDIHSFLLFDASIWRADPRALLSTAVLAIANSPSVKSSPISAGYLTQFLNYLTLIVKSI
ncbi:hypothetical protein V1520DRAFT_329518 [Lipomyces starkeyi]